MTPRAAGSVLTGGFRLHVMGGHLHQNDWKNFRLNSLRWETLLDVVFEVSL